MFKTYCKICGKSLEKGQIVFNEFGSEMYICSLTCLVRDWQNLKTEQIKTLQIMKKRRLEPSTSFLG